MASETHISESLEDIYLFAIKINVLPEMANIGDMSLGGHFAIGGECIDCPQNLTTQGFGATFDDNWPGGYEAWVKRPLAPRYKC